MLKHNLIIIVLISFFISCNNNNGSIKNIEDLQHRVAKLNELNQDIEHKRNEVYSLIREYNAARPDSAKFDITSFDTLMGAPEKELLKAMFNEEKDISYSGLLKAIVQKNNEIVDLKAKINELRNQLPEPYVIKPGDTHYDIVLNYLMTKHGLSKSEALKVAWRTALIDELLPNNEVWLMYRNGVVGSFVTQGIAPVSPMTVHVLAKQRLLEQAGIGAQQAPIDSTIKNQL
jgi:hypothetical protein